MKTWTKRQAATHAILLLLVVVDLSQSLLVLIYKDLLSPSVTALYTDQFKFLIINLQKFILLGGFPLIALVIRLNQDQLQKLNMDRFYVVMFITAGLMGIYALPYNVFAVIALIYVVYILFDNKVKFGVFDSNTFRKILLIAGVFAGIIFCITILFNSVIPDPSAGQSLRQFLLESMPFSIYEEVVYIGMLYMFLKDLGLSESKAFYTQAFLFWIKHINYLFSPLFFWVIVPILSLTLGYITFRSKSLAPSTIAHILYNALVDL